MSVSHGQIYKFSKTKQESPRVGLTCSFTAYILTISSLASNQGHPDTVLDRRMSSCARGIFLILLYCSGRSKSFLHSPGRSNVTRASHKSFTKPRGVVIVIMLLIFIYVYLVMYTSYILSRLNIISFMYCCLVVIIFNFSQGLEVHPLNNKHNTS